MSHDQRPARVKVVGVKGAANGAAGDAAAGAVGSRRGGAAADAAAVTPAAGAAGEPAVPTTLLSVLFIVASILGGIGIAISPLLDGR